MEKRARVVLAATAVALTAMLAVLCSREAPAVAVQTVTAGARDVYNSITVSGTVEASQQVAVCPYENARVTAVYASVGDRVAEGAVLCSLVPREGTAAELADVPQLWQGLSFAAERVVASGEPYAIRAPVSGTVLAMPAVQERVWSNIPCVQIADLEQMQVRVRAPETYAGEMQRGQSANITAPAADGKVYAASVASVAPVAVRAVSLTGESGGATVEAVLPLHGSTAGLRPGYSVTAKIFTARHENAVTVPYEAVFQQGEQEYVFCAVRGCAVQRPIRTGYLLENEVEVVAGLQAGECVILPPKGLAHGDAVEVVR